MGRSGMSIDRALRLQGDGVGRIIELFSMTRLCHRTHGAHIVAHEKIKSGLPSNTPQWVRAYLDGYATALWKDLYFRDLEFCYLAEDGTLYSTHKQSTHRLTEEFYARGEGHLINRMMGDHYWKGTSRVWSTSYLTQEDFTASLVAYLKP